jgi:hypothetical protein
MQDSAVTIAIISAVSSTIAALIGAWNNYLGWKNREIGRQNQSHIEQTKEAVASLEKNTNGIQDKLVALTEKSSYAEGLKAGQEEKKKE